MALRPEDFARRNAIIDFEKGPGGPSDSTRRDQGRIQAGLVTKAQALGTGNKVKAAVKLRASDETRFQFARITAPQLVLERSGKTRDAGFTGGIATGRNQGAPFGIGVISSKRPRGVVK